MSTADVSLFSSPLLMKKKSYNKTALWNMLNTKTFCLTLIICASSDKQHMAATFAWDCSQLSVSISLPQKFVSWGRKGQRTKTRRGFSGKATKICLNLMNSIPFVRLMSPDFLGFLCYHLTSKWNGSNPHPMSWKVSPSPCQGLPGSRGRFSFPRPVQAAAFLIMTFSSTDVSLSRQPTFMPC